MSRTKRRNKPHLIHAEIGTLGDAQRDPAPWWYRRHGMHPLPIEQAYARRVAHYTSDAGWSWAVPGWFVRHHCHVPERRFAKREILRCVRNGDWDDHLSHAGYHLPYYW